MGIDAQRGADIPVARQFLHDHRVDFLLQQHGSVSVTEPPGTERLWGGGTKPAPGMIITPWAKKILYLPGKIVLQGSVFLELRERGCSVQEE